MRWAAICEGRSRAVQSDRNMLQATYLCNVYFPLSYFWKSKHEKQYVLCNPIYLSSFMSTCHPYRDISRDFGTTVFDGGVCFIHSQCISLGPPRLRCSVATRVGLYHRRALEGWAESSLRSCATLE